MYSLFPRETPAPQPAWSPDQVPAEVPMPFESPLDSFTPYVFVCWIILSINVLVFVAMLIGGFDPDHVSSQQLLNWGADFGPATISRNEWWRLFTSMFVHLGLIHVGFNMFVLLQIGPFMERLLGNIAFLIVYLISGVAGALVSLAWNPYVTSAGASGAIFGLYGALIGFLVLRKDSVPIAVLQRLLMSAGVFLLYNAVFGVLDKGTDPADHAGGLIGGLICGLAISNPLTSGYARRRMVRAAYVGLAGAAIMLAVGTQLPRPSDFQTDISRFSATEAIVLAKYRNILAQAKPSIYSDPAIAGQIETQIIRPWRAERNSLAGLTGLPTAQKRIDTLLVAYMDERLQAWTNLVQGMRTHNGYLVTLSFQQQIAAQNKLKTSLKPPK
jgi:rhomboid protease GluP